MQPGDVKAEVLDENKWVRMGWNGTIQARLAIDRPVRVEAGIDADGSLTILLFEGLESKEGEQPIATLGRIRKPDNDWISHADGTLTILPRNDQKRHTEGKK